MCNYKFFHSRKEAARDETYSFVCESKQSSNILKHSLEGLAQVVLILEQNHYWKVVIVMLDYLLSLPPSFSLSPIFISICSTLHYVCFHTPRITWCLLTGKWLLKLFERESLDFPSFSFSCLVELFCTILEHSKLEKICTSILHLGRVVEHEELGMLTTLSISGISSTNGSVGVIFKKVS